MAGKILNKIIGMFSLVGLGIAAQGCGDEEEINKKLNHDFKKLCETSKNLEKACKDLGVLSEPDFASSSECHLCESQK